MLKMVLNRETRDMVPLVTHLPCKHEGLSPGLHQSHHCLCVWPQGSGGGPGAQTVSELLIQRMVLSQKVRRGVTGKTSDLCLNTTLQELKSHIHMDYHHPYVQRKEHLTISFDEKGKCRQAKDAVLPVKSRPLLDHTTAYPRVAAGTINKGIYLY